MTILKKIRIEQWRVFKKLRSRKDGHILLMISKNDLRLLVNWIKMDKRKTVKKNALISKLIKCHNIEPKVFSIWESYAC
jgi:hypothetical protein